MRALDRKILHLRLAVPRAQENQGDIFPSGITHHGDLLDL